MDYSKSNPISYLLLILITFFLLHKFKDFYLYNVFLILLISYSLVFVFLSKKGLNSLNNSTGILFIAYISYLFFTLAISTYNISRFGMDTQTLLNATGRLYLMPIFAFLVLNLIKSKKDFNIILFIYTIFIVLSALTLFYQHFFGRIDSWLGYNQLRYGTPGYASLTGNVVTYGPSIALAIFYLSFVSNSNFIIKSLFIGLISIAVFFTMSKSAVINLLLIYFLVLIFFPYSKIKLTLIMIFLIAFTFFHIDQNFRKSVINLSSQTSGVELEKGSIHRGLYKPIDKLIYDRIFSKWFLSAIDNNKLSKSDLLIGKGLVGGAAALSAHLPYDRHIFYGTSPNTFHSTYLDFIQMSGLSGLFLLIILQLNIFYNLFLLTLNRNRIAFILLLANFTFTINCFVANGVIFQPFTSFALWISVVFIIKMRTSL